MATRNRPISLANLRGFEASARLLSFTLAAQELHLTQSSVSRQIAGLEREIGKPLFRRGVRRLDLTAAGTRLLRCVQPRLAAIDATVGSLRGLDTRRRVTITTFASAASLLLVPRLAGFSRASPGIDIRIDAVDEVRDLIGEGIDLALRLVPVGSAAAGGTLIARELLLPVMSPAFLEGLGRVRKARDLAGATLLMNEDSLYADSTRASSPEGWALWFRRQGVKRPTASTSITLSYIYQMVDAALGGQGIALVPSIYVREHLDAGRLVMPIDAPLETGSAFYLVSNPETANLPHVLAFRDWLLDTLSSLQAEGAG